MTVRLPDPVYSLGSLRLDTDRRCLTGPRGEFALAPQLYSVAERLMRRPGTIVTFSDMISAIYPDPDEEPDNAEVVLRIRVCHLRSSLLLLSEGAREGNPRVRTERGIGYAIEVARGA